MDASCAPRSVASNVNRPSFFNKIEFNRDLIESINEKRALVSTHGTFSKNTINEIIDRLFQNPRDLNRLFAILSSASKMSHESSISNLIIEKLTKIKERFTSNQYSMLSELVNHARSVGNISFADKLTEVFELEQIRSTGRLDY